MELFVFAYGERSDIIYGTYNFHPANRSYCTRCISHYDL